MSDRRRFSVDDLFSDTRPQAVGVTDLVDAKEIRLDRIAPDPDQPRTAFDSAALEELAASIRREGVLQPIAVRYVAADDIYVIIHGERRWRAAGLAGLDAIPALVRDIEPGTVLVQQLMENIVREDLNALDRSQALRTLKDQMGDAPWDNVAERVGIRRSRLFQLLGTEKLAGGFRRLLRDGVVSEKQTRPVQRLADDIQEELAARVVAGTLEPAHLDTAARIVRDATTAAEARALLDLASAVGQDAAAERTRRAASRQTRNLSKSLGELSADNLPDDLRDELQTLYKRLKALLQRH